MNTQAKSMTADFSKEKQDAIFHHPDCKHLFEDKVAAIRVSISDNSRVVIEAFTQVLPELTDQQLSISDEEYNNLIMIVTSNKAVLGDTHYECHSGVFMLMVNHLKNIAGKYYSDDAEGRQLVRNAFSGIEAEIMAQVEELRDECIEEFYISANAEQIDEIDNIANQMTQSKGNNIPMPPPQIKIN